MLRQCFLAIALVAMAAGASAWFNEGSVQNKLIVTYSILPIPFRNFFELPRTLDSSLNWSAYRSQDNTSEYCYGADYRVCLLYDTHNSVAGITLSVDARELKSAGIKLDDVPEWEHRWHPLTLDHVYTATVFFQSKEELLAGGRVLYEDDLTAPNGIYILQTDSKGNEVNRLHVPNEQSKAVSAGFTEQSCFYGMGKHYFLDLHKDGKCEEHRPYFTLYGPKTQEMNGFGFVQYGKAKTEWMGRPWFESPPAKVAKMIAPNSPACLEDWVNEKGLFTMHVYFVSKPYFTRC